MPRKKKQKWDKKSIFLVPLKDDTYSLGQVLDLQMKNVVRCAFFSLRNNDVENFKVDDITQSNLISLLSITREQLC